MKQSNLPFTTNTFYVFTIEDVLFSFDDAKVRRFLNMAMDFGHFLHKKSISFDVNQSFVCEHTSETRFVSSTNCGMVSRSGRRERSEA